MEPATLSDLKELVKELRESRKERIKEAVAVAFANRKPAHSVVVASDGDLTVDPTIVAVVPDISSSTANDQEVLEVVHDAFFDCIATAPVTCSTDGLNHVVTTAVVNEVRDATTVCPDSAVDPDDKQVEQLTPARATSSIEEVVPSVVTTTDVDPKAGVRELDALSVNTSTPVTSEVFHVVDTGDLATMALVMYSTNCSTNLLRYVLHPAATPSWRVLRLKRWPPFWRDRTDGNMTRPMPWPSLACPHELRLKHVGLLSQVAYVMKHFSSDLNFLRESLRYQHSVQSHEVQSSGLVLLLLAGDDFLQVCCPELSPMEGAFSSLSGAQLQSWHPPNRALPDAKQSNQASYGRAMTQATFCTTTFHTHASYLACLGPEAVHRDPVNYQALTWRSQLTRTRDGTNTRGKPLLRYPSNYMVEFSCKSKSSACFPDDMYMSNKCKHNSCLCSGIHLVGTLLILIDSDQCNDKISFGNITGQHPLCASTHSRTLMVLLFERPLSRVTELLVRKLAAYLNSCAVSASGYSSDLNPLRESWRSLRCMQRYTCPSEKKWCQLYVLCIHRLNCILKINLETAQLKLKYGDGHLFLRVMSMSVHWQFLNQEKIKESVLFDRKCLPEQLAGGSKTPNQLVALIAFEYCFFKCVLVQIQLMVLVSLCFMDSMVSAEALRQCDCEHLILTKACNLSLDKGRLRRHLIYGEIILKLWQSSSMQCVQPTNSVPAYMKWEEVCTAVVHMFEQRTSKEWGLLLYFNQRPPGVYFGMTNSSTISLRIPTLFVDDSVQHQVILIYANSLLRVGVWTARLLGSQSASGYQLEQLWDPGGNTSSFWISQPIEEIGGCREKLAGVQTLMDALELSSECEQVSFQGGRLVTPVAAFVEQCFEYYSGFKQDGADKFFIRASASHNYCFYHVDVYPVVGYHGDSDQVQEPRVQWDPGGSRWHRLEVKPSFKEGGMLGTYRTSTRTWACLGSGYGPGPCVKHSALCLHIAEEKQRATHPDGSGKPAGGGGSPSPTSGSLLLPCSCYLFL